MDEDMMSDMEDQEEHTDSDSVDENGDDKEDRDRELREEYYNNREDSSDSEDSVEEDPREARARFRAEVRRDERRAARGPRPAVVSQSALQRMIIQFFQHSSARDSVVKESATLRLVKALHEHKLEDVILAIEQGARINFQVSSIISLLRNFIKKMRYYYKGC